jgi:hypothetical protein
LRATFFFADGGNGLPAGDAVGLPVACDAEGFSAGAEGFSAGAEGFSAGAEGFSAADGVPCPGASPAPPSVLGAPVVMAVTLTVGMRHGHTRTLSPWLPGSS